MSKVDPELSLKQRAGKGSELLENPGKKDPPKLGEKRKRDQTLPEASEPVKKQTIMDFYMQNNDAEQDDEEFEEPVSPRPAEIPVPHPNGFSAQPLNQPKKLILKNFKKKEKSGATVLAENWPSLSQSIEAIQVKKKVSFTLEQLYKIVENLCETKLNLGAEIYDRLQNQIRNHIVKLRVELCDNSGDCGDVFLKNVEVLWADYCQQMAMIRSIFLFLDRTYVLQNNTVLSLWETGLTIFREEVLDNSYIQKRLVTELLRVIADERKGQPIDKNLVRCLLRMLSSLQIYPQVFEREFLFATEDLYNREGDANSRDLDTADYFRYVSRRLEEEGSRVDFYLDEGTRKPLFTLVENALITKHMVTVLGKGLDALLEGSHLPQLELIFSLLSRVKDGQQLLRTGFANHIKKVGKSMVMDSDRDKTMVEDLMRLKAKLDHVVKECFRNEEKFQQAEKDAFDYFVNTRPNKPAELIAKYMDAKLRTGNKETSDEELDKLMDRVITLFRFIQGKDVFEAFYKKDLAKRLLLGRSASVDAEKAMLCKLKQECGAGFTHKLEGMFKDMELSLDLGQAFRQHNDHEHAQGRASTTMDFNVNVLTLGQWPPYEYVELSLPPMMCHCIQLYQEFYMAKHQGRKLQWQHSLGQCVLKGNFREGCSKELSVSLYQAIVLLLFNDCAEYTYEEIEAATKIGSKDLHRTILSLCLGKYKILLKSSKGKEINPTDKFGVNTSFQEKLYRIKISQIQMKETEEEHRQTEEQVNQDRQYQIDAAAVRIMKTRKSLTHQQLINELFAQLRFPVKAIDLKKRIGSLIEREYMARDSTDSNVYNYVA